MVDIAMLVSNIYGVRGIARAQYAADGKPWNPVPCRTVVSRFTRTFLGDAGGVCPRTSSMVSQAQAAAWMTTICPLVAENTISRIGNNGSFTKSRGVCTIQASDNRGVLPNTLCAPNS